MGRHRDLGVLAQEPVQCLLVVLGGTLLLFGHRHGFQHATDAFLGPDVLRLLAGHVHGAPYAGHAVGTLVPVGVGA